MSERKGKRHAGIRAGLMLRGVFGIGFMSLLLLEAGIGSDRITMMQDHPKVISLCCLLLSSAVTAGAACRGTETNRLPTSLLSVTPIALFLFVTSYILGSGCFSWSFLTDIVITVCGAFMASISVPKHKRHPKRLR